MFGIRKYDNKMLNKGVSIVKGRSLWIDARRRLFQNKAAVTALFLLIFIFDNFNV